MSQTETVVVEVKADKPSPLVASGSLLAVKPEAQPTTTTAQGGSSAKK